MNRDGRSPRRTPGTTFRWLTFSTASLVASKICTDVKSSYRGADRVVVSGGCSCVVSGSCCDNSELLMVVVLLAVVVVVVVLILLVIVVVLFCDSGNEARRRLCFHPCFVCLYL